ncbi:MAG: hypothetical protein IH876_07380 [Gemmatimonadetes bacterium]|nr:hypothetical protein [Gemmatimonadota bacterium]
MEAPPLSGHVTAPADRSAVAFSANPAKGFDTEVVIEACFGLGEGLVGRVVTPGAVHVRLLP